jgi:2-hydroxychromene-2-carboxylate isomerase
MNNIPFPPEKKEKVNHMWRDIERRAAVYGLPSPNVPAPYPLKDFDTANLVGIVLNNKNLYLKYFKLTYRYWFIEGIEAGSEANIRKCLSEMRQDYTEIMELAESPHIKEIYENNTLEALGLGVFGAPTFSVGTELFWGDDRLEDAINFIGKMA